MALLELPVLLLKNKVVFPDMLFVVSLYDERNIKILKYALKNKLNVFAVLKGYSVGTICTLLGLTKTNDGYVALLHGGKKAMLIDDFDDKHILHKVKKVNEVKLLDNQKDNLEFKMMYDRVINILKKFKQLSHNNNLDFLMLLDSFEPLYAINVVLSRVNLPPANIQDIFETNDILNKLSKLYILILEEIKKLIGINDELPYEVQKILLSPYTDLEDRQSLLVLGFVIDSFLHEKILSNKEMQLLEKIRNSLLMKAVNNTIN